MRPPARGAGGRWVITIAVWPFVRAASGLLAAWRPPERGGRVMTPEELRPPAAYCMYRATVSQHWILCPRSGPCPDHGRAYDHRTAVTV
jgi:hypothetical protein